jgi:hypothetical protein
MKLSKDQKELIYDLTTAVFKDHCGTVFDLKGNKVKIIQLFTRFSIEMESEDFQIVGLLFAEYLQESTEVFVKWKHRRVDNYLGFLGNDNSMKNFKLKQKNKTAQDANIAGMASEEAWSF